MLGIDLTKISRFNNPTESLIKKMLHPNEIIEYEKAEDKTLFLAARWAIKEALFKADNQYFHFNKVEIKEVNRIFQFPGYIITTTKEDDYYFAVVMEKR